MRGIIGVMENHYLLSRYLTVERAGMALRYLERHAARLENAVEDGAQHG